MKSLLGCSSSNSRGAARYALHRFTIEMRVVTATESALLYSQTGSARQGLERTAQGRPRLSRQGRRTHRHPHRHRLHRPRPRGNRRPAASLRRLINSIIHRRGRRTLAAAKEGEIMARRDDRDSSSVFEDKRGADNGPSFFWKIGRTSERRFLKSLLRPKTSRSYAGPSGVGRRLF